MRLFNDKGRFLGIVNPLDALVVISILAVVFTIGWVAMNRDGAPLPGVTKSEITQTYLIRSIRPEVAAYVKKGDRVKNEISKSDLGEVIDIKSTQAVSAVVTDAGEIKKSENPIDKDLTITVKANGRATSAQITVSGDILEVGKKYGLVTRVFKGDALLIGLHAEPIKK